MLTIIATIFSMITQLFIITFGFIFFYSQYQSYKKIKLEQKQMEEDKKKCKLNIDWFNDNLPEEIKTTLDIEKFNNFMDLIDEAILNHQLKYCILNMSKEDKEKLKEKITFLNKNYIRAKEAIYLALKDFITAHQEKITEKTAECFIAWYNYDHAKSNKIAEKYFKLNNIIDEF